MISQLINKQGNAVANQFVITEGTRVSFQSYNSLVAVYDTENNVLTFGCDWDYSNTTTKHLSTFLADFVGVDVHSKEIRKAIVDGTVNGITVVYDGGMR